MGRPARRTGTGDSGSASIHSSGAIGQVTDAVLTGSVAKYGYQRVAAYGLPVEGALAAYRAANPSATPADDP